MRLGIIGLPSSGKSTLFRALTGMNVQPGEWSGGGRVQVQTAVVDVPDPRLDALSEMQRPRKTTHAKVTYADVGGLQVDPGQHGLPGPLVNHLEQMDGLVLVLRAFEDPAVPHPTGSIDPQRDLVTMEAEFLLHDMMAVERSLERLREDWQKRGSQERAEIDQRIAIFERLATALGGETPLRSLEISPEEQVMLSGYGLLTTKPVLAVINIAEDGKVPDLGPLSEGISSLVLQGKLEMEIAQLPADEAKIFLQEYGISKPGLDRVIQESFQLLNLISFFTVSEPEVRAWMLPKGGTALQAADTIHTDMARGFIRAEVIAWEDLVTLGGLPQARTAGKLRLEGKEYFVADGEVIYIRFNI
jgi:GTP-binding protein YchF